MRILKETYPLKDRGLSLTLGRDLVLGGGAMVTVYFIAETLMPNIGFQGAVAELVPNLIQAGGGIAGGRITYAAFARIVGREHTAQV